MALTLPFDICATFSLSVKPYEKGLQNAQALYHMAKHVKLEPSLQRTVDKSLQVLFSSLFPWVFNFNSWANHLPLTHRGESFSLSSSEVPYSSQIGARVQWIDGCVEVDRKRVARLQEIFLVSFESDKSERLTAVKCYISGLYAIMNLPVNLPQAICRAGRWAIWPSVRPKSLSKELFSDQVLADIHRHFFLEKLWNVDLFGDMLFYPIEFQVMKGRAFLSGVLPPPTMLRKEKAKLRPLLKLKMHFPEDRWKKLEESCAEELAKQESHLRRLKKLFQEGFFGLHDIVNKDPRLLLIMCYISNTKEVPPVTLEDLFTLASQLLKTERENLEEAINTTEEKKENLFALMAEYVFRQTRWNVNLLLESAQLLSDSIWKHLQKDLPDTAASYVQGLLYGEFYEYVGEISKEPFTKLHDQLTLLRFASEEGFDRCELDKSLQSTLHDALVENSQALFLSQFRKILSS